MPVLLFKSDFDHPPPWKEALEARMPELEVRIWPDLGDASQVDYALVWKPPADLFARLPNLRVVFSLGAGLDHLLGDVALPCGVPVVRMQDRALTEGMSEYALYMTLRFHRSMAQYEAQQRAREWRALLPQRRAAEFRVGVMGLGVIGADVARKLAFMGYDVAGWSRSPKCMDSVESFYGATQLMPFLARSDVLICVLPLTAETRGIIDRTALAALPRGAAVINIGRGGHVVEVDLLAMLDEGHLGGAALDVFAEEPLPPEHPFWAHPRVTLTPHAASLTNPATAAEYVVENIRRHQRGEALRNVVDLERGY